MALWLAQVTAIANAYPIGGVSKIRDSTAISGKLQGPTKRKLVSAQESPAERMLKTPRLAALLER
eukprot:4193187-Karenia_brevis.AAC.1